jgi:uncharacterized membrane protein
MDETTPAEKAAALSAGQKETARVEAFSDGVFAIAITLLVIDLLPLSTRGGDVWDEVSASWPTFVAFVISFFTILVIWLNHHQMFTYIQKVDRNFLILNGVLLLVTTFVPFPTALVAQHILDPKPGSATAAAAIYAATGLGLAAGFRMVWRYAAKNRRLIAATVPDAELAPDAGAWLGPLGYSAAFVMAFIFPIATIVICGALAVFFAKSA